MKKALVFISLFLVFLFGISITAYFIIITMPSNNTEQVSVVIQSGQGVKEVSSQLKEKKLIKSKLIFQACLIINNKINAIQPGEYKFNQVNMQKIVATITQPLAKREELSVTILEGWNSDEMGKYLQQQGLVFANDFASFAEQTDTRNFLPNNRFDFLEDKPLTANLEGYLFPDTYRLYQDSTSLEIIEKMLVNFGEKITPELRDTINAKNSTIFKTIILASIVEKEAKTKKDKNIVAGIFLNRLAIGQKLESDATVNYVTGKKTTRPSSQDLSADSLYNTYLYSGLPIGPICSPGLASIEAAVHPEKTDYLFFLNTPAGNVVYSKTYEEHLANKNKYYPD